LCTWATIGRRLFVVSEPLSAAEIKQRIDISTGSVSHSVSLPALPCLPRLPAVGWAKLGFPWAPIQGLDFVCLVCFVVTSTIQLRRIGVGIKAFLWLQFDLKLLPKITCICAQLVPLEQGSDGAKLRPPFGVLRALRRRS
jgi:hypothetical protein